MTLTPKQTEAFCAAWGISKINRCICDDPNCTRESDRVETWPPLTLELLLGVCRKEELRVRFYQQHCIELDLATSEEFFPTNREIRMGDAITDMREGLIKAMAAFKNVEL